MSFKSNANIEGWHRNTDLGCDIKTILRSDRRMKTGKEYSGIFRCDSDARVDEFLCRDSHYTFIEAASSWVGKRNVHIFDGRYISLTRQDNGSMRLNFKKLNIGADFSVEGFALAVANEIQQALKGLIEEIN